MNRLWAPWRMKYIRESIIENSEECIFCVKSDTTHDSERLILHRGKSVFVLMNKFPYNNGHLLIAPYRHIAEFSEVSDEEFLEMQKMLEISIKVMRATMYPQGFNIGVNIGRVAGAGIEDHLHYHILPRWNGDTNFLPVFGEVKVISESLEESYARLKAEFDKVTSQG